MTHFEERNQYQNVAEQYDTLSTIPQTALEADFVTASLISTSLQGKSVLDLGGGTGIYARKALILGAASVDLVEISSEMLNVARTTFEAQNEHGNDKRMRFFVADAAQDLSSLGLNTDGYDVVMVNWLLDHATSDRDLEAFWRNISTYTKPGGWFVGVRMTDPWSISCTSDAKYGVLIKDFREIPGGVAYQVRIMTDPPFEFEATSMEKSYSGSIVMHEKFGFERVVQLDPKEMDVVKRDPTFWKIFTDNPYFGCVSARKRG